MNYTITGYSTALFATWINIEELNLLFDAGDGLSAGLLQKAGKIKHVFITHPDRDHLTGLPQFMQLNARKGFPKIHYPYDSGSFPALNEFLGKFDPHISSSEWIGIKDKSRIEIKKNILVEAIRNEHISAPIGTHKSLSYKVYEQKNKLKDEYLSLSANEIQKIAATKGRDYLTRTVETNILSFSGDTPVDDYGKYDKSEILIHEATFLNDDGDNQVESRGNKHSKVDDVLRMVKEISINSLILTHFSSRYSRQEIDQSVRKLIREYAIQVPVYIVYPGEVKRNILTTAPVNEWL